MAEAADWLRRGHQVQVICEAIPWVQEPDPANTVATHKRTLSFAAMSGQLPIRVLVYLVASFHGPCPNLGVQNQCEVYPSRPLTCRIYPAEVNPFVAIDPDRKACPPQAWEAKVPLMTDALYADVRAFRQRSVAEVEHKAWLCKQLGICTSAISNQGYAIHTPAQTDLLQLLLTATTPDGAAPDNSWVLLTHVAENVQTLRETGALCENAGHLDHADVQYLSFV